MTESELETAPPGRAWRALLALVGRLPQAALSRGVGRAADIPIPTALRPLVLTAFARSFGIDVSEAELPLAAYPSVNAFFVRRLRPGSRPSPDDPTVLASPVDGVLGASGPVTSGRLLQAIGRF
jgi:phosphatidylserine decarboxylase